MDDLIKEALESHKELKAQDLLIDEDTPREEDVSPEEREAAQHNIKQSNGNSLVKWFSELSNKDITIVGGKGASLGEMYNHKFPIPPGFVITAQAYTAFLKQTNLQDKINTLLNNLDIQDTEQLQKTSREIRDLIEHSPLPKEIEEAIKEAYEVLDVDKQQLKGVTSSALSILRTGHEPPFVAVRSSATTEDLADASFAGQQESFLNVKGEKELLKIVKQCFSSLFTARAIYYRTKKKFDHEKSKLAVVIQKMVDSDKSGVIFSRNPIKQDESIVIEAVWGLGEGIVSGKIKPDNYIINRNVEDFKITEEKVTNKKIAITRNSGGKNETVKLSNERSNQRVLSNYELKRLAQYAIKLESHYQKPQDIEFAIEGEEIYIVQSRPITTVAREASKGEEIQAEVLLTGLGASPGINAGTVKIVYSEEDLSKIKQGDILVTEMTNPDMVVTMQKSAAIITDEGGVTSHAAIVSREMGIPAVVGTETATKDLKDGQVVTVDGNSGKVYAGRGETHLAEIKPVLPTKTKLKIIVDLPEAAQRAAKSEVKAIGLTRLEGLIAQGGKHPLKFVKENKTQDYIKLLAEGLDKISQPFEEIWIRTSDIRSDEFMQLDGASQETEGNPMLGNHGIRFSLRHTEILKAELTAVKEVADEYPHKKFGIMIPQVISISELKETKRIAREEVVVPNNIKIGIMVETPAAVQQINEFCEEGMDFISFGTNDLTQYILAIDRNNGDVQYLFDEMHPAVLSAISYVIRRCQRHNIETSICGQAGSKPEMVKFLVEQGINSISVNADAAYKVSQIISEIESQQSSPPTTPVQLTSSPPESTPEPQLTSSASNIVQPIEAPQPVQTPTTTSVAQSPIQQVPTPPQPSQPQPAISPELPTTRPQLSNNNLDIEQAVLQALENNNNTDYQPGPLNGQHKPDIPPLHSSSDISSTIEDEPEQEEMDLTTREEDFSSQLGESPQLDEELRSNSESEVEGESSSQTQEQEEDPFDIFNQ